MDYFSTIIGIVTDFDHKSCGRALESREGERVSVAQTGEVNLADYPD